MALLRGSGRGVVLTETAAWQIEDFGMDLRTLEGRCWRGRRGGPGTEAPLFQGKAEGTRVFRGVRGQRGKPEGIRWRSPKAGGRVLSSVCGEELTMQEWQAGKDARDNGIHAPYFTQEETEAQVHTATNEQH